MDILQLAPVALLSFGSVWIIVYLLTRYTQVRVDTTGKLILGTVFAFIFLFLPVEFQNELANKIRDAVAVTIGITALYQGWKAS